MTDLKRQGGDDRDRHLSDNQEEELEDGKAEEDQFSLPSKVEEISPNERYVRFAEVLSHTENIKVSYRGFDTRNGIEVAWHAIDLSGLDDAEQEEVARSANSLKELESEYIAQYLSVWVDDEPRRLVIITALLESLKEFIGKVRILRWRIVKKWIVHRNVSCDYIYINGGEGQLRIGNTWLSAILGDASDPISFSETMTKHSRIIGSPAYNGPEIFEKRALDTKADIYSLGICMVEIITRSEPYAECKGVYSRIAKLKMLGVPPLALLRVTHPAALQFIDLCLRSNPLERPTADELKRHPFLEKNAHYDDDEVTLGALPELPGTETPEDLAEMHAVAYAKRNAERPIENEVVMSEGAVHVTPPVEHVTEVGYSSHADSTATDSGVLTRAEPEGMPSILTREASGDQIGPGSRTTPRNNPVKSTKFGKEFAALYKGEDVREDKGVQDGRRPQGADGEEDGEDSHKPSPQMPQRRPSHQSIVYAASDVSVSVDNSADSAAQTTPIFSGYDNCSPVHVNLKISREHTLDGEGREVEFMFHPSNDDFQVVAKEMIEELALTLPVNNLAEIIHIEVTEAQRSVIAAYAALGEERKSHGASQLESLLPNDFNQPATLQMTFDCVERSVCVDQKVEDVSTMQNSFTSAAINDDIHPRDTSTPAETEIVEITVVPATDCVPSANQTRTSVETAVIKELVQHDSTQNDDSDDDLGLMDEEDEHLKQEIVRIDKEAGHARRVFEQRIQKHKSIQASLDEDIENRKIEYSEKLESINKKLDYSRKKADDEKIRLQNEFQEQVNKLRDAIKQGMRQRIIDANSTADNASNSAVCRSRSSSNNNVSN